MNQQEIDRDFSETKWARLNESPIRFSIECSLICPLSQKLYGTRIVEDRQHESLDMIFEIMSRHRDLIGQCVRINRAWVGDSIGGELDDSHTYPFELEPPNYSRYN